MLVLELVNWIIGKLDSAIIQNNRTNEGQNDAKKIDMRND